MKKTDFLKYVMTICFAFLMAGSLLSQKSYYYQKEVYPEKKGSTYFENTIKTDLISLAAGDLALLYEHRFSDKFGLEGGAGFLLQPTEFSIMSIVGVERRDDFKSNAGFSLMLKPRFYTHWFLSDIAHFPFFRFRQYQHLTTGEIGYGGGYTFFLSQKVFIEISASAGLLFQWPSKNYPLLYEMDPNPLSSDNKVIPQINLSLIFGCALK
ncbi:MAG: hypothetical protein LBI82_02345 [Dysgonamonadaceae bacterium]|jgi:hypothetical protein|nr:hypothetical protein [Dysgonamonadaceae bacterium]